MQLWTSQDRRPCMKASLWEKKFWLFYGHRSDNIESYASYNILLRPKICDTADLLLSMIPQNKNFKIQKMKCISFYYVFLSCFTFLHVLPPPLPFFFLFRKEKFIYHILSLKPHIFRSLGSTHFGFLLSEKKSYLNIITG